MTGIVHAKRCPAAERDDAHAKAAGYEHAEQAHHDRTGHWCGELPKKYRTPIIGGGLDCSECEAEGCEACPRWQPQKLACTCGAETRS